MQRKNFQIEATQQFLNSSCGLLIDLPAGSGKSLISYDIIEALGGPVLLCAPVNVVGQHLVEIPKFTTKIPVHYQGESIPFSANNIVLVSPYYLRKYLLQLCIAHFTLLIFDESHILKNRTSKTTRAAICVARSQPWAKKLLMTATPSPEGIGDIQPQIEVISEKTPLGTSAYFAKHFERKINCGTHWKTIYLNKDLIKKAAAPFIFKRDRKEIGLPPQTLRRRFLPMPTELQTIYEDFTQQCLTRIDNKMIFSASALKLLQICAGILIDTNMEEVHRLSDYKAKHVAEIVATHSSGSVLIWGTFREELRVLSEIVPDSHLIYGGTTRKRATQLIKDFKDQKYKVLISHPASIGIGISLEVADLQICHSLTASCALFEQMISRTNRINQTKDVMRYELLYRGTHEDKLAKLVHRKKTSQRKLMEAITTCLRPH